MYFRDNVNMYYSNIIRQRDAKGCANIPSMFAKPSESTSSEHSVTLSASASEDRTPELATEAELSASPQPLPIVTTGPSFTEFSSSEPVKK